MQQELSLKAKSGSLDAVLCGHIVAMVHLLNMFLDESLDLTWKKASEVVARSEGCGMSHALMIWQWVVNFPCT